jgi:hypothetical protein
VCVGTVPCSGPVGWDPSVIASYVRCLIEHCVPATSTVRNGVIKYHI